MSTKADILKMIGEEGVEFIRLQFTNIFGALKNIAVTPSQIDKLLDNKYSFVGSALFGERFKYDDMLYLYPEPDSFMILPWRPQQGKVAKIVCDVCYEDGRPFELSSRYILKNVLKGVKDKGYTVMADPECEFFLFNTDENGLPTTKSYEMAGYLDVGPSDFGENARRDIVLMLEEMGFEIVSSHHEHAPAQHEIDFEESEALLAADSIQNFRFAVRSIAKRFGLYATFMPKPNKDVAGSGMHTHFTILKNGRNIFRNEDGTPSEEALYFTGGILAHARALSAIANPTVNSYKRLLSGFDAPNKICWDYKGEDALVKVSSGISDTKVELRFPDGSCNPYLLLAACITAGLDGIEKKTGPGENLKQAPADKEYNTLPENLREAVDELKADELIRKALGEEFTDIYCDIKYREWRDYMCDVSSWEIDRYLTRI